MKAIMIRAWEIAKQASAKYGHSAKSYIGLALKAAWAEIKAAVKAVAQRINELEALGFNRWQKAGYDRLYINAKALGMVVTYRRTGSISSSYFNGESISHAEASRMLWAKTFIDVRTGICFSDNPALQVAAMQLAKIA